MRQPRQPSAITNSLSGKRFFRPVRMPCSVATMKVFAPGWRATAAAIPVVEQTSSASSSTSARHSGWAMTTAPGRSPWTFSTLALRSTSWMGQAPS
jgi:hypothetical protein